MRQWWVLTVCVFASVAIHGSGQTTLTVPGGFPTIQAAINAASPGDVVELAAGTYQESLVVSKSVTIRGGTGSPDDVVVMPTAWDEVLLDVRATDPLTVVLEHMTFAEGWAARAIYIVGPVVARFTSCVFDSNQLAIEAATSSTLELTACTFTGNDAGVFGQGCERISVLDCGFEGNSIGLRSQLGGHIAIQNSSFRNNDWNHLWFSGNTTFEVSGCDFSEIYGEESAAAISVDGSAQGAVRECRFVGTETPAEFNPGPGGYYPIANAIETKDAARLEVYDSEFNYLRAAIMMWGGAYIWAEGNTARNCCHTAFRIYRPSSAEIHVVGNTVGEFGGRSVWCCPLVELSGTIQHPIEISNNVIGDTGGCLAFSVSLPLCSGGAYPENEFKGTVVGQGNVLTSYYRQTRQCPSWRSPFWPSGFIKD